MPEVTQDRNPLIRGQTVGSTAHTVAGLRLEIQPSHPVPRVGSDGLRSVALFGAVLVL